MSSIQTQQWPLDRMPHFIAVNYQAMRDAPDDQARVQAGLDTFDRCLRLLTISLVSQYLVHDLHDFSDPHLNRLLAERFPLGDLQSWRNVLLTVLKAYEGHPERLFAPEIYHLYWDTADPERHRPRVEIERGLDRLAALDNDWHSHKNLPTEADAWATLAREVSSLIDELLKRLAFLANYELLCITKASGNHYVSERHMGQAISVIEFDYAAQRLQPYWYYLSKDRCDFLLLNPLLMPWHTRPEETAIFRRLTKNTNLLYLLTLTGEMLTDTTHLIDFLALMDRIEQVKRVIRKTEELTWLQVSATAVEITANRMATVAGKFDSDVYLQRQDVLALFKTFMASEARCFVLTGKSGAGKSNFVLSLPSEYQTDHDLCLLMIDALQIDTGKGLNEFIASEFCRHWGVPAKDIPNIWEEVAHLPGMDCRRVLLVLDAINENTQPRDLLKQINELLQQSWKWLKVLLTVRPEAWQRMYHGQRLAESLFFQPTIKTAVQSEDRPYLAACDMQPFDWGELRTVYARYQAKFDLKTAYDDLSADVHQLIREPLQLWMIANTYQNHMVSATLTASRLVESYIHTLLETHRLYEQDIRFLQCELVPLMAPRPNQYTNVITVAALEEAGGDLLDRVFSEGYYSTGEGVSESFQRLADAHIVVKRVHGMASEVQFKYERFYEYFLGEYLYTRIPKWSANIIQAYRELIASIQNNTFILGVVQHALYVALQNRQFDLIQALAHTDDTQTAHLIVTVLVQFSAQDARAVRQITRSLLTLPRAGLTPKDIALRVALQMNDGETLRLGLLNHNRSISSRAVQYVYFLNQTNSTLSLDILERLIEPARRWGFPNAPVIRTVASLGAMFLAESAQDDATRRRLLDIIARFLRRILYAGDSGVVSKFLRTWLFRVMLHNFLQLLKWPGVSPASVVNLHEWEQIFRYSLSERAPVFAMLPYLDCHHGTWDEITTLLPTFRALRCHLTNHILQSIIMARGALDPDNAWPVIEKLYNLDYGGNLERIDAIYCWFVCLEFQQEIKPAWLDAHKRIVKRCLEENNHGYGIIKTDIGSYQYYPLMFYASIWNRVYPGEQVDLIVHFLKQAEETGDRRLQLHIIDGFGDNRFRLADYRGPLRSLQPFVSSQDEQIQEHLARALARLYGAYAEQISHFLIESGAPRLLMETVRQWSLHELTSSLYMRGNFLTRDALLHLPPQGIHTVICVLDRSFRQNNFHAAAELIAMHLLNELGGGNIFFNRTTEDTQ